MSKYGFTDETEDYAPIKLPGARPAAAKPKAEQVEAAVEEGRDLGFVPREIPRRRKPGRKRGEPKAQLLISGPERVIDQFRSYCEDHGLSYWQAIEMWMDTK